MNSMTRKWQNLLLIAGAIALAVVPLALVPGKYGGADGQAQKAIESTGYKPWFKPIYEPPSGEIASLLFSAQAALGAGVVGYVIGRYQGRQRRPASPPAED